MFQIVEEYMPHVSKQEYMPIALYYAKQEHRRKMETIRQELVTAVHRGWTLICKKK
jgi:hypothetical protein